MTWSIRVLDKSFNALDVASFRQLRLDERFNLPDVLQVQGLTDSLRAFMHKGYGIRVLDETGAAKFTGFLAQPDKAGLTRSSTLTFTGDLFRALARFVYPVPDHVWGDWGTASHDTVTGPAETRLLHYLDVNAGPSAITARRVAGLTIPATGGRGPTGTSSERFTAMTDLVAALGEEGNLRVTCLRSFDGSLPLVITQPPDLTATAEGPRLLDEDWTHSWAIPTATVALVAGGGEGTGRTSQETVNPTDESDWAIRIETFVDQRDSTDVDELVKSGEDALTEAQGAREVRANVKATTEVPVGTKVALRIDGELVTDRVRQISTVIGGEGATSTVTPIFGSPDAGLPLREKQLRLITRDIRRLKLWEAP